MSDDTQLRLLLRQLYESAEAGVRPPGAEAAGRTLRRRARRKRALALAAAVVLLVGGVVALTTWNRPAPNPPVDVPTSGPVETVSPSGSPTPSPSASAQAVGAPVKCPPPGATRDDGPGVLYVIWSPQTDLPPECQNRPTPVLVLHYRIEPDRSGVLDNTSRYVLDQQHPKVTVSAGPPTCDAGALYVVVGDVQPLARIANVDSTRYPYDRPGVSYSFWDLVTPPCNTPPASPTPSPSPSPSP